MKEDVFQEKPLFEKYGGFLCTPSPSPKTAKLTENVLSKSPNSRILTEKNCVLLRLEYSETSL